MVCIAPSFIGTLRKFEPITHLIGFLRTQIETPRSNLYVITAGVSANWEVEGGEGESCVVRGGAGSRGHVHTAGGGWVRVWVARGLNHGTHCHLRVTTRCNHKIQLIISRKRLLKYICYTYIQNIHNYVMRFCLSFYLGCMIFSSP